MASGAYAKFMGSCRFVEGRSVEQCTIWFRVIIPQQKYIIDGKNRTVISTSLMYASTAVYKGQKFGCTLK